MPISTRELKHIRPQRDGTVRVQEVLTADVGHVIRRSYRAVSKAQAVIDMNARDVTEDFVEADFHDLLTWTQTKNDPGDFDFTNRDLDLLAGEERLLGWFVERPGNPAMTVAWWIESLNPPSFNAIRDRVGLDLVTGSEQQDRAIGMVNVEPLFNVVADIN